MSNKKRYIIVMVISVIMNQGLLTLGDVFDLPVWLDTTGTALAAMVLEPTAGLMVGLINNFYSAVFIFDISSIIFYAVSAAVALIVGLRIKEKGRITPRRAAECMLLVLAVTSVLTWLITMWKSGGISDSPWEMYYYNIALAAGAPRAVCSLFGIFVIRIYDTIASAAVVAGVYLLLPRKLRYATVERKLSYEDQL